MWQFGFPTLAWGFLLVLVPLAIHLIQLLRHRRVKWAAMDFLLQSYKRHRKWVWLRQFFLLLSRMLAIGLLVLMLAQWKPQSRLLGRWGGATVHHYVLLDDSISMSERSAGGVSTFEVALAAVGRLLEQAREQEASQRVTLLRFSRAEAASPQEVSAGAGKQLADLNSEPIDARIDKLWEETRRQLAVSQRASIAVAALKLVQQLVQDDDPAASKIVHLVSDFRRVPWEKPADLRAALAEVQAAGARLEFIHCARQPQPNLAITRLQPEPGPQAAGVPLYVTVEVTNFSPQVARNVQLKVRTLYFDPTKSTQPGQAEATIEDLPVELVESIAPGQAAARRVQVFFPQAGAHVVEASLPEDAVTDDNRRWCVVEVHQAEPVLVVDGDLEQRNAFYLESIFQPGPAARTGIQPIPKDLAYLRDVSADELAHYTTIYLLDVPRLDVRAVENIERFVADGGGLAVFLGPRVDRRFYNDWLYRGGEGFFPLPLEQQDLMPPEETGEPDVNVDATDHPVFRDLLAGRNPLIRLIHVDRFFSPPSDWRPPGDSTIRVVAALRSGQPFMVERSWGNGRVLVCTSTYAPLWNDMVLGPNAILALQLQAYLAQGRRRFPEHRVGEAWSWELSLAEYLPDVKLVLPDATGTARRSVDRSIASTDERVGRVVLSGILSATDTNRAGIYEMWSYRVDGQVDVRRRAVNVDTRESDLTLVDMPWLVDQLLPARVAWRYADQGPLETYLSANLPPNVLLLILLVSLLMAEQALGYAASYHPPQGARV